MNEFIYLLEEVDADIKYKRYKIGYTTKSISKRIKQLQTGNPNKLSLLQSYQATERGRRLESMLHTHYKFKRISGEWFELDKNDIESFIEICNQKQHIIELMRDNPFF